jgi:ribosomal-protein-alanine N-acetyltransferase
VLQRATPGGFVLAHIVADECEILSLGVGLGCRRAGLGRKLLRAVLDAASESGVATVHLEVAEDNVAALRLYAAEGFIVMGKRRAYYSRAGHGDIAALALCCNLP